MSRVYNFNAGPCTLPLPVLEEAQAEFVDYQGKGMSLLEMSHRSDAYAAVHAEAMALVKRLYGLPDNYQVLFLGGGATLQFSMVPLNLMGPDGHCDFTLTGAWSQKAAADARRVGTVNPVFDGQEYGFTTLPDPHSLPWDASAAYCHLTSNETIDGLQWHEFPDTGDVPLVCDMSSDFVSRPIPVEKFSLIYAGAQKNAGPAGTSIVIIRDDLLERCSGDLTSYLSYPTHAAKNSMYNTPPVFAIYMLNKTLSWLEKQGGLLAAQERAKTRADLIYQTIAQYPDFYHCPVDPAARSQMNIVFRLPNEELERRFVAEAEEAGMYGLKGHRSVGGCRASVYNAMPLEGVEKLRGHMSCAPNSVSTRFPSGTTA